MSQVALVRSTFLYDARAAIKRQFVNGARDTCLTKYYTIFSVNRRHPLAIREAERWEEVAALFGRESASINCCWRRAEKQHSNM
jgi:hypothetical protein